MLLDFQLHTHSPDDVVKELPGYRCIGPVYLALKDTLCKLLPPLEAAALRWEALAGSCHQQ